MPIRVASLCLTAVLAVATAARAAEPVSFSGVYPHLAALSTSYSEAGIGALVPWADRLWYVSYVAHIAGGGVGLYEITPDLDIRRRPESVVGTHAGRMIHRESNQLILSPYAIDAEGRVRVIEALARERVTAVMRHLTDPANKVYVLAMEGRFYETDVHSLETKFLVDLQQELGIGMHTHFKGGYTAQGRVVVANNSYFAADQARGEGPGRLAEWDGHAWTILARTAFCDVTTAAGVETEPADQGPLLANGWDRRSVILKVLTDGQWTTYRLPKGSQSYDQAWCTEWPRIRTVAPGRLMLDMHGLYYLLDADFRTGQTASLAPWAGHLKMTPDFCVWRDQLVMAGDDTSSMDHRHRTGGQPQSNLWFGSVDALRQWGPVAGWGGPWLDDEVAAGVASDPFLIQGFTRRSLHLWQSRGAAAGGRCADEFTIIELPDEAAGLARVGVRRGSTDAPGAGYAFTVDRDVTVYLAVQDRGDAQLPAGWERTPLKLTWEHGGLYTDTIYKQAFPAGRIQIPPHQGRDDRGAYGVPHLAFLAPSGTAPGRLRVSDLPSALGGVFQAPAAATPARVRFTLEIDREGTGDWSAYKQLELGPGGYVWHALPDDLEGVWLRLTPDRAARVSAQFHFGPRADTIERKRPELFAPLASAEKPAARIEAAVLPFADRLWCSAYTAGGERGLEGLGLFTLDEQARFTRREESVAGVFANRKMAGGRLSIGPHLVSDDGGVETLTGLEGRHVVSTIRHPDAGKMYLLTVEGTLLEADLASRQTKPVAEIGRKLGLEQPLRFKGGHLVGKTVIVATAAADGRGGCLAEWDGERWSLVDRAAYAEVSNLGSMSEQVAATGWDAASAIVKLRGASGWSTCRLPKASAAYDTAWGDAWPRIREVVTERMLVDAHGMMYEMSGLPYAPSIKPIAAHRRLIADFCSWRGVLVLAGCQAGAAAGPNLVRDASGAALWMGTVDDLWQFDRPTGTGGPWLETAVEAGKASDPYLMTNFERKRVELRHDARETVSFTLEIDPTVQRQNWQSYRTLRIAPGKRVIHEFPEGFSAHWVRVKVDRACKATAQFDYE